jgi:hypothetical protein
MRLVAVENVAIPLLQDTSVCAGTSFVMPRGSGIYNWSPAVTETETSFVFTPLESATYTLSYSETGNCYAVDSFRITVIPRYVSVGGFEASYPDTFASPPFSVRFSSLTSGADSSLFVWYFGDSTSAIRLGNPIHVYPDTGSYVVSFVMLPPPGYCGASVYSDTIRLVMRDTTNHDTTSRIKHNPVFSEKGIKVYPNPAQDEVRIHSERTNCTLSLYDAVGKQILGDVQVFAGVETKFLQNICRKRGVFREVSGRFADGLRGAGRGAVGKHGGLKLAQNRRRRLRPGLMINRAYELNILCVDCPCSKAKRLTTK